MEVKWVNLQNVAEWPWTIRIRDPCLIIGFTKRPNLFVALYHFYKASIWGIGIRKEPNTPIYLKGFLVNSLIFHLQGKIVEMFGKMERILVKLWFQKDTHKTKEILINKFGHGCWNGGQIIGIEARFTYGPFDSCASVNILDFIDSSAQHVKLCGFHNISFERDEVSTRKFWYIRIPMCQRMQYPLWNMHM